MGCLPPPYVVIQYLKIINVWGVAATSVNNCNGNRAITRFGAVVTTGKYLS